LRRGKIIWQDNCIGFMAEETWKASKGKEKLNRQRWAM
jgi:hypothetical protein